MKVKMRLALLASVVATALVGAVAAQADTVSIASVQANSDLVLVIVDDAVDVSDGVTCDQTYNGPELYVSVPAGGGVTTTYNLVEQNGDECDYEGDFVYGNTSGGVVTFTVADQSTTVDVGSLASPAPARTQVASAPTSDQLAQITQQYQDAGYDLGFVNRAGVTSGGALG